MGALPRLLPLVVALLFCASIVGGAPASAAVQDHPAEFCAGDVAGMSVPISKETVANRAVYRIEVETRARATASGVLTLITDRSAYRAAFTRTPVANASRLAPLDVTLPSSDPLQFVYVDSIGIDGATPADCPTQVDTESSEPRSASPASNSAPVSISATFVQSLPALACDAPYVPVRAISLPKLRDFYAPVAKDKTTEIKLWLDSNGALAGYKIMKSSGDDMIDIAAITAARAARFAPARFLCQPVVGTFTLYLDYELR